ncbi:adenylate/guanylate cyclase domain-containing protein [Psychrosphaera sp. F3M07]|uniref:CHASE2 domain-containing protein n=1 Tax=Psychrosphaera sp. F3M07 TaxID=2841560 RepID=UPI001C08E995|nr:adenylate/guanylate cyclase domain-containing protein [Psychrosphaera sp. F3M07]MBU2919026.1 adenylate/guanylate cyclase domain-containing protein [Psychrosphaera sp. F3M07]
MNKIKKQLNTIVLGLILTILFATLVNPSIAIIKTTIDRIEGIIYDIRLNATLPEKVRESDHNIFVVDIDEKAIKDYGRFPWTRHTIKQLITNLVDAGVVVIAFDVIFPEPELNPLDTVFNTDIGQRLSGITAEQLTALRDELDADTQMAQVLGDTDIVLGVLFQQEASVQVGKLKDSTVNLLDKSAVQVQSLNFPGQLANLDVLQQAAYGQGFINSAPDPDGFIRRAALVIQHNGQFYPSLALEAARLYNLSETIDLETTQLPHTDHHSITAVKFGNNRIPTDEYGRVLVPFRGGQKSFPYYSAADVLNGSLTSEELEGGIAFIGTSAVGLADLRSTSVGLQYPGVEVHANILEGILQTDLFSYRPDWWQGALLIQILLLGIILSVALPLLGPMHMAILGGVSFAFVVGFNLFMWDQKIALPVTQPLGLVLFITFYNLARGFFAENSNKQKIKSMFDQYVPPAHIDKMLNDPSGVSLEGERKEMSVLFSDIRSFTSISEKLSANDLKDLLNEYFSPITKSIFEHQGTIDKYVGDMVMAFWGAPLNDPNHAENAVIGGFDMLKITAELRQQFLEKDWPAIYVGIGINTGDMNVGDMGSEYRRAYTVLGDAVNLGSRLESLTKFYGLEFLVSEFTKAQCPNILFRPVDKVKVKGKEEAVAIFEPVCESKDLTAELEQELKDLDVAYHLYLAQKWDQANLAYKTLLSQYPNRKIYQIYIERIEQLKDVELEADWDGSFTHTSK